MEYSYADVIVIGAGPAGLVLAELVARRGLSAVVVEKQSDPAHGPQGALLQPVTLDLLRRLLGFEHEGEQEGSIKAIEEYGPAGLLFARSFADLDEAPVGYALNITQGQLRRELLQSVTARPSVSLWAGTEVNRLDATAVGRCCTVVRAADTTGPERALTSRWVIAADGKPSATRSLAGIRANVEGAPHTLSLVSVDTPDARLRTIKTHRRPEGMATVVPGASPGKTYVFTHLMGREVGPDETVEWAAQVVASECRLLADVILSDAPRDRLIRIEPQIVRVPTWRSEGVVLLGDSAHGMHNIGGQGLNTAIQDAVLLAEAMCRPRDDDVEGIDSFIRQRRPFIDSFQDAQRNLGHDFWPAAGDGSWFRGRFEELSLGQAEFRKSWDAVGDESQG